MRPFGIVACGLLVLSGTATATAQTTVTRQITTEPVETIITRGPNGTVVSRRPLNPEPPAVGPYAPAVDFVPYNAPAVVQETDLDQTVTVRRGRATTARRAATRTTRRNLALSPAQRQIIYRTVVQREVYPTARPAYPPVVAQTEVVAPAPRSYPLRTIYPFQNDSAYYNAYTAPRYEGGYATPAYDPYDDRYRPRVATYVVGSRLPETVPLVAVPESVALQVPAARPYSYAYLNGRVYLVDPATGIIVADVTP